MTLLLLLLLKYSITTNCAAQVAGFEAPVQRFHRSLSRQATCFAARIIIFFKRLISATHVLSSSTKIYTN